MAETLERSVLERKERDELATIASALGMKPSGRAKKDTLIDQILKTAGVIPSAPKGDGAESVESVAKRPRGRRPKIDGANDGPVAVPEPESPAGPSAPAEFRSERLPIDAVRAAKPVQAGAPRRRPVTASMFDPFADADAAPAYDSKGESSLFEARPAKADPGVESAGSGSPGAPGIERRPGLIRSSASSTAFGVSGTGNGAGATNGSEVGNGSSDGPIATVPTPAGLLDGSGQGQNGGRTDGTGRNRNNRDRDRGQGDRMQGDRPQGDRSQGDRPQGDRPQGDRPQGAAGNQGQGGGQGNRNFGEQGNRFDNTAGGKRNRRRRGRDREQVSPERDAAADRISETYQGELIEIDGLLDISDQGYGYIRAKGYLPSPQDVYVPVNRVKQMGLRKGDRIVGKHRPATPQEKFPAIITIDTANGMHPEVARLRPKFEDLTPLFPDVRLRLEQPGQPGNMVSRIIDLMSPIGKGQRGLIVSPPKAGKTTIMKQIATSIENNNPDVHLMVLLIDERPEEVTDMRRHVKGEVIASTFDKPSDEHTMVAELALDRAKRLVEEGKDVVIILDGITRLARAYNLAAPATGRIMSGGIDTGALYPPKKFFGAARNIEEGGSLTILATALVETGSTMDTVIYEEFKGTGNMELRLDRRLAEKRVYPAINVNESSTRHEELLFERSELQAVWMLRRVLIGLGEGGSAAAGLELLMDRIKSTRTNVEFLAEVAKANVSNQGIAAQS